MPLLKVNIYIESIGLFSYDYKQFDVDVINRVLFMYLVYI